MGQLDPDKYDALDVVNTQVAEQFLLHLLIFVYTFRNTSALRAHLWLYLILHNWNIIKKECRLCNSVPSNDQKKKLPYLYNVKVLKCRLSDMSERSRKRIEMLIGGFKFKPLKDWLIRDHGSN